MSEVFFPALFPGFEPPEELAQAFERLAVVHAELDRDARTIRLDAQAEKYLAEKQLQTLCRAVEKAYGLKSLELLVRYPEEGVHPRVLALGRHSGRGTIYGRG